MWGSRGRDFLPGLPGTSTVSPGHRHRRPSHSAFSAFSSRSKITSLTSLNLVGQVSEQNTQVLSQGPRSTGIALASSKARLKPISTKGNFLLITTQTPPKANLSDDTPRPWKTKTYPYASQHDLCRQTFLKYLTYFPALSSILFYFCVQEHEQRSISNRSHL